MADQLITQLRKQLYSSIKKYKGSRKSSRYDTSDIAQESIIQVWKKMETVGVENFQVNKTFLKRVGQGQTCNFKRHHSAQCRDVDNEENAGANECATTSEEPHDSVENEENVLRLLGAVAQLSVDRQTVFCRRVMGRSSFVQIAEELGESVHVVRARYKDAISDLRRILVEP